MNMRFRGLHPRWYPPRAQTFTKEDFVRRHIFVAVLLAGCLATLAHASTTVYPIGVNCSPAIGQLCDPPFDVAVSTQSALQVQFTASVGHCSDIRVYISVDGFPQYLSGFLGPGDSTGVVNLGPVAPGSHTIGVQAEGRVGGCNAGDLASWAGGLSVTTSLAYAGTPGRENCHGQSVSALAKQYGGLATAAQSLGFASVQALQKDIRAYCGSHREDDESDGDHPHADTEHHPRPGSDRRR